MEAAVREIKVIKATKNHGQKRTLRVGAYCRVSTDSDDQINSFYAQMRYYTDYIREHEEMELVDIYADEGITGTAICKRDEFKRMMKDCKNRKIDRILVKSVTRFARNSLECIKAVRDLKSYGTSVYFESDNIDTEHMNSEMILYIKSKFAEEEAISASRRMRTSIRMKMENGTFVTPTAAFGYKLENGELIVVPEEAEIIRKIFQMYLSGEGVARISKYLRENHCAKRAWRQQTIGYILKNERYIGDSLWQKRFTTDSLPFKKTWNKGQAPKYYCNNTHEPIISRDDFEKVQKLLEKRTEHRVPGVKIKKKFFDNKIFCRHCNWRFKAVERIDGYAWTCARHGNFEDDCGTRSYTNQEICDAFINVYNRLKQNEKVILDETIYQLQTLKSRVSGGNEAIIEIDKQIAALSEQKRLYSELYRSSVIDEIIYTENTDSLQGQITELRARRLKILNEDEEENCIEELRELKRLLQTFPESICEMREDIFDSIVEKIYIEENGAIMICLKCGLELKSEV